MQKTIVILFGAPGSGKGYLGECIKKQLIDTQKVKESDIAYISTGDLLRAEIAAQTCLGKEIEAIVTSGRLVPDTVVRKLVEKALQGTETLKFIDGYPRTDRQLLALRSMVQALPTKCRVITLKRDTPVSLILERVSKRRVCKDCKCTHSVDDGKCPKCGGESVIRKDDAVIENRLEEYTTNTAPLWNNLALVSTNMLVIDGTEDAEVSAQKVVRRYFR